ncbi:LppP/LprE family lipoprotein [Curtobacterium luteum]|uniref:LppP/LprE family lipoprotein n=1 Tax=Curtobacterium luteum TaxID=33881 RepID=UPI003808F667
MRTNRSVLLVPALLGALVVLAGCSSGGPTPQPTATRTVTAEPSGTAESAPPTDTPAPVSTPSASGTAAASGGSSTCSGVSAATATARAVPKLAAPAGLPDARWDARFAITSAYEPCAALSAVLVPLEGSTASSPVAILLFHDGQYLGTATKEQYAFVPDVARTSDDTIAVTYHWVKPGETDAESSGRTPATFTWDASAGKVVMRGGVPPQS